jgi:hypothetical protein
MSEYTERSSLSVLSSAMEPCIELESTCLT